MTEAERLRDYMFREREEPEKTKEATVDYIKTQPHNNKEWLLTLEAEEVYKMKTEKNLKEGIIRWLNDPRTETDN